MSSSVADGVLAATHKLVQQAMSGQWQEVPKTVAERRVLLDRLAATASPQDQQWLSALKQAMEESDAAVARMAPTPVTPAPAEPAGSPAVSSETATSAIDSMMDMISRGRSR